MGQGSVDTGRKEVLPVLVMAGAADPCHENLTGIRQICDELFAVGCGGGTDLNEARQAQGGGFAAVPKVLLYGGARHEVFNETNRDEVTADLLAWLNGPAFLARTGSGAGRVAKL